VRLCFIADYGSPTAVNWIDHFVRGGYEVHVISTGRCGRGVSGIKLYLLAGEEPQGRVGRYRLPDPTSFLGKTIQKLHQSVIAPYRVLRYARSVKRLVDEIQPDLLHALRIPIEGELALLTGFHPFMVSIWGNDLTLHAHNSAVHRRLTKETLAASDAVLADCNADLVRTARILGKEKAFTLVAPGGGGVRLETFGRKTDDGHGASCWQALSGRRVIANPRGIRTYVRHDTVFKALALVKNQIPDVALVCTGLKGWSVAEEWIERLSLTENVILTEVLKQEELAQLFRISQISVSISEHDGTPNSLLESMASGAIPICGRLESTREWIQSGVNGWLVPADNPQMLAEAIVKTISDQAFRQKARELNQVLIRERATYPECMRPVEELYMRVANHAEILSGQRA
jgi:glycosyltransferase involved in cell wall biosynthesis